MRSSNLRIQFYELINPSFYLLGAPVVVTTSVLANADLTDSESISIWLAANLLALANTVGSALLIRRALRNQRTFLVGPLGWVITGYLIGAFKGFLTFTFVTVFLEPTWGPSVILTRTALAAFLGIPILLTAGLAIYFLNIYKQQRDELFHQSMIKDIDSEFYDSGLEQIRQNLEKLESDMGLEHINTNQLALQLRDLAERSVRPLSHKIWQEASKKVKDYSLGELLRAGIATKPFSPLGFAAASFVGLVQWSMVHQSGWSAIGLLMVTIAPGVILSQLGNQIKAKSRAGQLLRYMGIYVSSALAAVIAAQLFNGVNLVNDIPVLISLTVWFMEFGLVIALTRAGIAAQKDLNSTIKLVFGDTGLSRVAADASKRLRARSIAQSLHSDIQNRLLGTAMHVEAGVLDSDSAKTEIASLRQRILSISIPSDRQPSIKTALSSLCDQWRGFISIQTDCEEHLEQLSISNELSQVLNELVLNAKRHGLASSLSIRIIQASATTIELTAIDNGLGPQSKRLGLGHELFESLTAGNWSLTENKPEGSKVVLSLEISRLHL